MALHERMAEEVGYPIGKRKRGGDTPGSDKKTEEKSQEGAVVNKESALSNDRDRSRSSRRHREERSRDERRRSGERRDNGRSRGSSDRRR